MPACGHFKGRRGHSEGIRRDCTVRVTRWVAPVYHNAVEDLCVIRATGIFDWECHC